MSFTFDHMHIRVPNPDATADWFGRVFGAEVIRTTQQGQPRVDIKLEGLSSSSRHRGPAPIPIRTRPIPIRGSIISG